MLRVLRVLRVWRVWRQVCVGRVVGELWPLEVSPLRVGHEALRDVAAVGERDESVSVVEREGERQRKGPLEQRVELAGQQLQIETQVALLARADPQREETGHQPIAGAVSVEGLALELVAALLLCCAPVTAERGDSPEQLPVPADGQLCGLCGKVRLHGGCGSSA